MCRVQRPAGLMHLQTKRAHARRSNTSKSLADKRREKLKILNDASTVLIGELTTSILVTYENQMGKANAKC